MSSSDSDFQSVHKPMYSRTDRKLINACLEQLISDVSDEETYRVTLNNFSSSDDTVGEIDGDPLSSVTPCTNAGASNITFNLGITQILSDSYDDLENIPILERVKSSCKKTHENTLNVHFLSKSVECDFSGFENTSSSRGLTKLVVSAEIHDEHNSGKYTQVDNAGSPSTRQEAHENTFHVHFPSESDSEFLGFENFPTTQRSIERVISDDIQAERTSESDTELEITGSPTSLHLDESYLEHFKCLTRLYHNITSSEENTLDFLKATHLIPPENTQCPKCKSRNRKGILKYRKCRASDRKCNLRLMCSGGGTCKYKVSPFSGTFFDGATCRLSLGTVIQIIYCFIHQVRVSDAIRENEVSKNTITDYYNYCREVCALSLEQNFHQIGGPGEIVEIDESKFFTRKYNRGRILSAQQEGWVFGGIERSSKECFMVRVKDRSKETLLPLITKYIKPGTTIISDEWKAYGKIKEIGYQHYTICHKKQFVDPENPSVHTQNIECSWRYAKATYPERYTSEELRDSYLQEFLYRRKHKGKFIQQFIHDINTFYKHKDL